MKEHLAPAGSLVNRDDPGPLQVAFQRIADERSRLNGAALDKLGLRRRLFADVGPFLRKVALHPDRWIPLPRFNCFDHVRFYNRNRRPYALICHPYSRLSRDEMKRMSEWATQVGLDICVDADSEYYPGVCLRVVFYREGTEFYPSCIT